MNFSQLRNRHKALIYEGFNIIQKKKDLKVTFNFLLTPNIKFKPFVIFPNVSKKEGLENLVFNLGMVELLSYWKPACPPEIIIKAGFLNEEQILFWKKLLIKGLGEFFYTNKIDFTQKNLVEFKVDNNKQFNSFNGQLNDRDLILVGGGKDSAVTLETISKKGKEFNGLLLNPTQAAIKIAKAGGCKNPIIIKRIIDPKLLELNRKGYLNGHTPFSAYLAFLSALAGVLYNYKNLIVSNEASSNESNVIWMNHEINHQYSKTAEFEKDFRDYSSKYLAPINYFSFLRKLGELQISEMFSKMDKYHLLFRSCNKGSKQGIWCGKCPKCVSTYLLLYPFMGKKTEKIFGQDLVKNESFIPIVKGLLRENNQVKPFECVATVEEIKTTIQKNPKVLQVLKNQKTLILGFGKEGKATLNYFKRHYPDVEIGIADQSDGKNYLEKIKNYDVIVKSPGIPYLPQIKEAQKQGKTITSATKIFFDKFKGKIIGVTGTKGKSTTASLIYEVLKQGGVDVYLLGNIGKPALELLDKINENSTVVYELSSFQLADLTKSPHIAVITNIYPDHLDWHGSFENYKKAKANITKYQIAKDHLIENKDAARSARIIGKLFKIPEKKIQEAITNFKPLPHRLEFAGEYKKIKFYNDSLATNPHATIYGLKILGEDVETLIAGGLDRGVDYSVLGPIIAKSKIKNLILFPDTGEKIGQTVSEKIKKFNVDNMKEAVKIAYEVTSPGKIVLLSPASASFNLFKDYEDRGEQFKKEVLSQRN